MKQLLKNRCSRRQCRLPKLVVVGFFISLIGLVLSSASVFASPYPTVTGDDLDEVRVYSPYADRAYTDQVFFGNTHLHEKRNVIDSRKQIKGASD